MPRYRILEGSVDPAMEIYVRQQERAAYPFPMRSAQAPHEDAPVAVAAVPSEVTLK